tara:strand:- start:907 stop:1272 length:366 start_codon:yes stop_codon:yes gene_type:complete
MSSYDKNKNKIRLWFYMNKDKEIKIVYWRDIPAQILIGRGRSAKKIILSEKFEKTIDICAMKTDSKDMESYLKYWRKSNPLNYNGEAYKAAETEAKKIELFYSKDKLRSIIDNNGWNKKEV